MAITVDIGIPPKTGAIVGGGRCLMADGTEVYVSATVQKNEGKYTSTQFYISTTDGHTLGNGFKVDGSGWKSDTNTLTFVGSLRWHGVDVPCKESAVDKPGFHDVLTIEIGGDHPTVISSEEDGWLAVFATP